MRERSRRVRARLHHGRRQQAVAARHLTPLAVVVARTIGNDAAHQQLRGTERNAQAFAGQRVDVARCVTNQQNPSGRSASNLLPQRAGGPVRAVRDDRAPDP